MVHAHQTQGEAPLWYTPTRPWGRLPYDTRPPDWGGSPMVHAHQTLGEAPLWYMPTRHRGRLPYGTRPPDHGGGSPMVHAHQTQGEASLWYMPTKHRGRLPYGTCPPDRSIVDSFICRHCHYIVANSPAGSHSAKCRGPATEARVHQALHTHSIVGPGSPSQGINTGPGLANPLPTFEAVCSLKCATIRHIPQKARPSFARILSDTLRSIVLSNSEEAWLKLFMLPKCVLRASHHGGRGHKPHSIEELCRKWSEGHFTALWQYASDHARKPHFNPANRQTTESDRRVHYAISKARKGLLGKTCKVLTSSGTAPNTPETWDLLCRKHPMGPVPPSPVVTLPTESLSLPPDFNVMAVLHQFPRDVASGPSGLRIQHLIEAAEVPVPTPICASLRAVINILVVGDAPAGIAKFMAGGSLTALNKKEEGAMQDIRPIAAGEALRRLTGKLMPLYPDASKGFRVFRPTPAWRSQGREIDSQL